MESPPENRTVRDGRDETFSCKAGGAPTPNITWIFNGQLIFLFYFQTNFILQYILFYFHFYLQTPLFWFLLAAFKY